MTTPILHSLIIASVATGVGFLLTLPFAYWDAYSGKQISRIVEIIFLLPLVLPPTIVGFVLLQAFGRYGFIGSWLEKVGYSLIFTLSGATLATTVVVVPLIYQGLKGAFKSVDSNLIDAAQTLSANQREILFRVILPNCWHAICASLLLAFCRGLGEFGASLMVAGYIEGRTDTIATTIYFAVQQGNNHLAVTLSIIDICIGIFMLILIQILTNARKDVGR